MLQIPVWGGGTPGGEGTGWGGEGNIKDVDGGRGHRIAGEGTEKHTFTLIITNFNYFAFLRKACGSKQLRCAV